MAKTSNNIFVDSLQVPVFCFSLKQYDALIECIEDIEDRLTILERIDEPELSHEEVEKGFSAIFDM